MREDREPLKKIIVHGHKAWLAEQIKDPLITRTLITLTIYIFNVAILKKFTDDELKTHFLVPRFGS